ncbi:MAG: diguanylate cyclase [Solirubrobacterales bacterium]|nr:diguanylate cyclase [Solirubrobacterales bacterium]
MPGTENGTQHTDAELADLRRELRELDQRFAAVFDRAPIGMAIISIDGRWLTVNETLCRMLGYSESELLERTLQDVMHRHGLELDLDHIRRALDDGRHSYQVQKRYLRADGRTVWVSLSVSFVRDGGGEPLYYVTQAQDISAQKTLEAELREAANRDPLTGLKNRRGFEERLDDRLAYARRYGTGGALLLLDLDDFKSVNDSLGHHAGDELLRGLASHLADGLRTTDVFARYGGDEFALLLPDADAAEAETVADRLIRLSRSLVIVFEAQELSRTVSVGVVALDRGGRTSERDLFIAADRAMYRAKAAGGDCWCRAAPGQDPEGAGDVA